jgi:glycosyltransferase involved in cell wall biosynthesis
MNLPQLAIVVPTRNSSELLPRLVRSLKEQTLQDFRVIFVDASTTASERHYLIEIVRDDPRFSLVYQDLARTGIFDAMNIGFSLLRPSEWVLFWGSDDWASSPSSLFDAISDPGMLDADLVVCRGRYISPGSNGVPRIVRATSFCWFVTYRLSLFLGSTPPHQCTLIGPGARCLKDSYNDRYRIAADLEYFLTLSSSPACRVRISPVQLVDIAVGGISGVEHRNRIKEVLLAYCIAFGPCFVFPFIGRYLQRLATMVGLL